MSTVTTHEVAPELAARGRRASALVQRLVVVRELGILAALLLLIVVTVAVNPRFLSGQNVRDLLLKHTLDLVFDLDAQLRAAGETTKPNGDTP